MSVSRSAVGFIPNNIEAKQMGQKLSQPVKGKTAYNFFLIQFRCMYDIRTQRLNFSRRIKARKF